jgi:hypothetical protein
MAHFEKIVKVSDAVLDCIPIASTLSNAAQALYKLAHKVDALNPVAPGLKTSLKIHVLSKTNLSCFVGAIPILGNLLKLVGLVLHAICGFRDDLMDAVSQNNGEIVHLSLCNGALDSPERARDALRLATARSDYAILKQILDRGDWSAESLMYALNGSCYSSDDDRWAVKVKSILDYWDANGKLLDLADIRNVFKPTILLKHFLETGKEDLAERVIKILPKDLPFILIKEILGLYSCPQFDRSYNIKKTAVLTEENRQMLIDKSRKPSLSDLKDYFSLADCVLDDGRIVAINYRVVHFNTLDQLLAQLSPDQTGGFISFAVANSDRFVFIEPWITQYKDQLTPESKGKILRSLAPSLHLGPDAFKKRVQLFETLVDTWKKDVASEAAQLYTDIFGEDHDFEIELSSNYPEDVQDALATAYEDFRMIFLQAFPYSAQ